MKFDDNGLIPAIVRDARSGAILTLAYMNEESLAKTRESGETWFWSRSRNELWHKGVTSGNTQQVVHIAEDCDSDALVVSVIPSGPACHTGSASCFSGIPSRPTDRPIDRLFDVLRERRDTRPAGSYSASLFNAGRDKILKKVNEEATEVIIASKFEGRKRLIAEVSDLIYHLGVLLVDEGLDFGDIEDELRRRER
jgi:phosphoribosyl-ATP pyrophosphohydrolase/phosphoribosyl-AMP cyclohydrolase